MTSHQHQWVFAGEVVIPTNTNEIPGNPFNRLEYCIVCGGLRIKFKDRWRYWYSDATKKFLDQFNQEEHRVLKFPPTEFVLGRMLQRENARLGRGLKDIAATAQVGNKNWKRLFSLPTPKKGKPDAKGK
jgi:hypothetical protein